MREWKTEIFFVLIIFLFSLTGHILFNGFFHFLSLALMVYLSWHLYHLKQFYTFFTTQRRVNDSVPAGFWGFLYKRLNEQQNRWLHYRHNKRRIFSRFQQAFKHFPYSIIILDKSWKIRWYNKASETIFNKNGAIINHYLCQLIDHPILDEYLSAGNFELPLEIESPINKVSILSLQFIPLSTSLSNQENETLLLISDITSAYHLAQARKDFIANVTHELKTPLTVFSGFLEPMCEDINDFPEHWGYYIELMYQQSVRMNDIINDLLLLSKLEMNQSASSLELINMPELLHECISDAELLAQESGQKISTQIQEALNLKGEVNSIKMIINNLLANAIKYTPQRSNITVSWYAESEQAYLIVQDSGEGIAARHLSRLTERFYRVETDRSREKGGTGLGLSIVNHALLRHQGQLNISSEIGRGSIFTCIFPKDRTVIGTVRNEDILFS